MSVPAVMPVVHARKSSVIDILAAFTTSLLNRYHSSCVTLRSYNRGWKENPDESESFFVGIAN